MKGLVAGVLLLIPPAAFAQAPDGRDSVIIESKTVEPGNTGSPAFTLKVYITNKDTLANLTLPVEIRTGNGAAFVLLNTPRTFNGTINRLTSTLGNSFVFSPFINDASQDSAVWSGFWDPNDTSTAEPPNSTRKAIWEIKFSHSSDSMGMVQMDSATIFDNKLQFVSVNGEAVNANFAVGTIFIFENITCNCPTTDLETLFGRGVTYDFDCSRAGTWHIIVGPGTIDQSTGVYQFSPYCFPQEIPVIVRLFHELGSVDCSFTIKVTDNPPVCSPAQNVITISHGQTAANQINASDPDGGGGFVFSKLSGPGGVNSSGGWSYPTGCADVTASPQTVRIKTADAFGSCNPGPMADTCEFQLVVTNAAPTVTNCPADVLPADTGAAYSLQLTAADADPADAGNLSFFLVSAPAGFTVSSSGLVQWTPSGSQWGLKSATVQVRDLCGAFSNCQINFAVSIRKGDMNADGSLTPADLIHILNCIFQLIPPPVGSWACDLNCSGNASQADAILLLNAVFLLQPFPC
ncbi:MAG: Ig-like domain-containing protein [Limisphaerales bacterium]